MKFILKRVVIVITITGFSLIALGCLLYVAGLRINTSSSIRVGLYWMTNRPMVAGEYVIFCPPNQPVFQDALNRGYINAGFCSGGYGHMMKKIVATAKDTVSNTSDGVWVNGERLPYSKSRLADSIGRPLPVWRIWHETVPASELLLMTDQSSLSFDARYFGLLTESQMKSVVKPLITWPSNPDLERD